MVANRLLSSSQLRTIAGCTRKAFRVYCDRGLIAPCRRQGRRRYDGAALARLRVIVSLRALGLSLDTISALLAKKDGEQDSGPVARELIVEVNGLVQQASERLEEVRRIRNQLIAARETLIECATCDRVLDECRSCSAAGKLDGVTAVLLADRAG